jgi:hypothetical protein
MIFDLHQSELLSEVWCVILSLALQWFTIRQHHIHKILFCITYLTDNRAAALYFSCAVITDCICTVECHLQFDTNKARTDTKRSPATAQFHGSVPVILDETQTFCKYMENTCRWSQHVSLLLDIAEIQKWLELVTF